MNPRFLARRLLDNWAPEWARGYREWRDLRHSAIAPALRTAYGFDLAGADAVASPGFEKDEIALFQQALRHCAACIDIGANVGLYTCLAAAARKPVLAFEPIPANLQLLCRNLLGNGFHQMVEVFPIGLADRVDVAPMSGGGTGASLHAGWNGAARHWQRLVPVSTLDTLLAGRFPQSSLLIKADVEGAEYRLLQGARATAARTPKPVWLLEISLHWPHLAGGRNPDFAATFEFFLSLGYRAWTAEPQPRPVTAEMVAHWVAEDAIAGGFYNFLFACPQMLSEAGWCAPLP